MIAVRVSKLIACLFVCGLLFGSGPDAGFAQEIGRVGSINASGVPYKVFAESGEATIRVYVLGSQGGTGIYEIGADTRFDELLTLAAVAPTASQPRTRQRVTVRLYHQEGGQRVLVFEERLEDLLQMNPNRYPELQNGDFVQVEVQNRNRFGWRDALQIVSSLSTLALLIERFARVL